MVVQIATLLLVFLKEEEAYCVLKLMIEDSTRLLSDSKQVRYFQQINSKILIF